MKNTLKQIIKYTLIKMDMYSEEACDLVYETGMAESGYRALEQKGGPALGFFQCEPETADDILKNYVIFRSAISQKLIELGMPAKIMADIKSPDHIDVLKYCLITNIALQVAFCRLKYRRDKDPIPTTKKARAAYWKKIYNTKLGKGTVEHYMKANK
tara:strand:+ start:6805 stop:7275 length:471 start_codon:yes stop_codon:yes gene_type:complete